MDKKFMFSPNEKPLDNLLSNGGLTSIFRKICVIGDSLSSGEFESRDENGNPGYHDMYEYSWGQFIARMTGSEVSNFSRGGMSALEYTTSFADSWGLWDNRKAAQCYIIALGVNDMYNDEIFNKYDGFGSTDDICTEDFSKNKKSFVGCYAQIIQRYKLIQPEAKFFLVTVPKNEGGSEKLIERADRHQKAIYDLADKFSNTYVIDLRKYGPEHDEEFCKNFQLYAHLNPAGYYMAARAISSYIDYIIRHDFEAFARVGFIPH